MSKHQKTPSEINADRIDRELHRVMILCGLETVTSWDSSEIDLVGEAIVFAAEKHTTQRRKDKSKSPYIEHPLRVMRHLIRAGIRDHVALAVAVLHDTVEDTDTTIEEIEKLFGKAVATSVRYVTDDKSLSKVERKRLQIARVKDDGKMPLTSYFVISCLVTLADKLDNLIDRVKNPPEFCSDEENKGYIVWAFHVVRPIMSLSGPLKRQLCDLFDKANIGFSVINSQHAHGFIACDMDIKLEEYYALVQRQEDEKAQKSDK